MKKKKKEEEEDSHITVHVSPLLLLFCSLAAATVLLSTKNKKVSCAARERRKKRRLHSAHRMSKNNTAKVGYMKMKEIKELDAGFQLRPEFHNQQVPTIEEALTFVSSSVRQVILDVKVGPPSYEKGLAKDILTVVKKTNCKNCLIWTKSDTLGRDVMKLQKNAMVGYIVMKDPSTGATSKLLRMKDAAVVGVYHPLIDERLVRILHRRGKKVYAWTVDDTESMQRLLFEHVDAIVTNHPSLLQGLMQDMKTECLQEGFPLL